jgi:hypothetical protein
MKAIGKLGILKSIGEKQFAILREDETIITKIDMNDWLMDKIGNHIYFRIDDESLHITDLDSRVSFDYAYDVSKTIGG